MMRLALAGVADPRHRWFTAAADRRRAGVRMVGLWEPDATHREAAATRLGVPAAADLGELVTEFGPTHVAVSAGEGSTAAAHELIELGVDVFLVPPTRATGAELDGLLDRARASGRRVEPVHVFRSHQASRLAKEMVDNGSLGRLELVCLTVGADVDASQVAEAAVAGIDLFGWLSGDFADLTVLPIAEGDAETAEFGTCLLAATPAAAPGASFEVRRLLEPGRPRLQLLGEAGAVEWDVRTGVFAAVLDGRPPVKIMAERNSDASAGIPEWVLGHHLRARRPEPGPLDPFQPSRIVAIHLGPG